MPVIDKDMMKDSRGIERGGRVGRRKFLSKIGPGILGVIGASYEQEDTDQEEQQPSIGLHPGAVSRKKRG